MSTTESFVYAPLEPSFDADPNPTYRYLREHHPVFLWEGAGMYLVSRHADVQRVLTDPRFGIMMGAHSGEPRTEGGAAHRKMMRYSFFSYDGEAHARIRRLVVPAFTPHAVAPLRQGIAAIVTEVLDGLGERDTIDVIGDFAAHVPARVISGLLGVPGDHAELFRRFAKALILTITPWLPDDEYDALAEVFPEAVAMVGEMIEQRRADPGTDLLSKLVHAHDQDDRLSIDELLGVVASLIVAGSETVVLLIAYAVKALLEHPDALAEVRADPALLPGALAEAARFEPFNKHGAPRVASVPVELSGVTIPAGAPIVLLTGSALRDDAEFADPDRFDIRRPASNLMFGAGPHFCFGHVLAKLEAEVALEELLRRFPGLSLDGEPAFHPSMTQRCMESLRVSTGGNR